jgi:molybdopterin converting factor small subunit
MDSPIRVNVEFLGPFEAEFDTTGTELTLPASATVATLLEALAATGSAGERLRRLLGDGGSPRRRYCYVSVDYAVVDPEALLDTPLHDGARVCFGAPMAGG